MNEALNGTINQISSSSIEWWSPFVCSLHIANFQRAFGIKQQSFTIFVKHFYEIGLYSSYRKMRPPFETTRRDLIDGTIDSLIHVFSSPIL